MRAIRYPCRCLWRLFWQMTSTVPWRRMILHFSHIGFTDGLTFMIPFGSSLRPGCGRQPRLPPPRRIGSQDEFLAREQDEQY
jgi:hypothetical protein